MERYRIVIDVKVEIPLANEIFYRSESAINDYAQRGRVALYRVETIHLEKNIIEKEVLIRATTL